MFYSYCYLYTILVILIRAWILHQAHIESEKNLLVRWGGPEVSLETPSCRAFDRPIF